MCVRTGVHVCVLGWAVHVCVLRAGIHVCVLGWALMYVC